MNTKQAKKTFLLTILALFAGACVVNVEEMEPTPAVDNGERLVTLALSVPGLPASRGLTTDDESEVKTIDVLLFNANANEYFRYRAVGDIDAVSKKNFTVKLPGGTWNVVVLANAGEAFDKLVDPYKSLLVPAALVPDPGSVSRREVLERLVLQLDDKTKKWPEGTFKGIPMWGYYDNLNINPTTSSPAANINLTRAVARVNVSVVDDDDLDEYDVQDVFELASVRLYNYNRAGSIAPAAVNGAGYNAAQWNGSEATLPNLPALSLLVDVATPLEVPGPLVYDVLPAQKHGYNQEIYTFEAAAGAGTTLSTNTCLVIGGRYNGGGITYYRVDFAKSDGTYLPLLRNHSYDVKIVEVIAAGHAGHAAAFDNQPANIRVEIVEDEGSIGHIVFDENYLGVSSAEIVLQGNARADNRFSVITDVAGGWIVTGTSADWITMTASAGGAGVTGSAAFSVLANDSGGERVGYIHLTAGRLHLDVKVTQRVGALWVTGEGGPATVSELFFASKNGAQPDARPLVLHWIPASASVNVMTLPASGAPAFTHDPASDAPGTVLTVIDNGSGEKSISVRPAALDPGEVAADPFVERASRLRFDAFLEGEFASAEVELRYVNYHTMAVTEAIYMVYGGTHAFTVKSNSTWVISIEDGEELLDDPADLEGRAGGHNVAGETIPFMPVASGDVTLLLTDLSGRVDPVIVVLHCKACGSNGIGVLMQIGNNEYLTHAYGGKCWMVENSREGETMGVHYYARYYNNNSVNGDRGYYYTWAQAAANACPEGWRLPTKAESEVVRTSAEANEPGTDQWWLNAGILPGFYRSDHGFTGNNNYGYWWCNTTLDALYAQLNAGLQVASTPFTDNMFSFTVRCVME